MRREYISQNNLSRMNNTALITESGTKITYKELQSVTEELAGHIAQRSVVGIISSNTPGSIVGYIACLRCRHVAFLMKEDIMCDYVKTYISMYRLNYLWVPDENETGMEYIRKYRRICSIYGYSLYRISEERLNINPELALLLSTSGTTGGTKLVRLSYDNVLSNTESIAEYLNITSDDVAVTSLPMSYTYGLSVINTHLYANAVLLVTDRKIYTGEFWDFFDRYGGTTVSGVPYMYRMMRKLGIMKRDMPGLKTMTAAGGKLSEEDEEYFIGYALKYGKKILHNV